jgi:KipI family sensor histidine kinase inhibitor
VRRLWESLPPPEAEAGRVVEVPVVYGGEHGPDLEFVARHTGLEPQEVIRRHSAPDYLCYVVGFTPGFPFLGGMDPALTTPRLEVPRSQVPVGAVAIGGAQTGVYPLGGPGGWRIIGRTPLLLYDPWREPPGLINAGDRVRFRPVPEAEFPALPSPAAPEEPEGRPVLEVLRPGAFTTVQDMGRWGYQYLGVPVSGALDSFSLAAANLLVGNPPEAAALEITLLGPRLKVLAPVRIAVVGAELGPRLDGRPAPQGRALSLQPGQVIDFSGPPRGARAVLAVAGGISSPVMLGSRSVYPLGLLGGPLQRGQVLHAGPEPPAPVAHTLEPELVPVPQGELTLRVVPGPNQELFTPAGQRTFYSSAYQLTQQSDRRGMRLQGPAVELDPRMPSSIVSEPITPGVVQVPAGGQPIVQLREQTVGGYAKIATVISADLDRLARALPGTRLRFQPVTPEEGYAAARRCAQRLARLARALGRG